tara:strand:- start:3340 stop:3621 length:282 start_codon:yes stop_codon:yes gene_type:complete
MKVIEIMERAGINQTGRAIMYIKEALNEIAVDHETHTKTARIDIVKDKRFYEMPNDCAKVLDIRAKNHDNTENEYRSLPRSVYEPFTKDSDGV